MESKLFKINDQALNVKCVTDVVYGQMHFFSELIDELEQDTKIAATLVKSGIIQRKLNAIYSLLDHELSKVKESGEIILKYSRTEELYESQTAK